MTKSTHTPQPIKRILFPTDFSPASTAAFAYAERLAASTGAELFVLHVFPVPNFWGTGGESNEIEVDTKRQLLAVKSQLAGVQMRHFAHGGSAGKVICWEAQRQECDQIVMGTHGHTGLTHVLLGSVAEYVVRHARCPVLTIRQRSQKEEPLKEPEVYVPMPAVV